MILPLHSVQPPRTRSSDSSVWTEAAISSRSISTPRRHVTSRHVTRNHVNGTRSYPSLFLFFLPHTFSPVSLLFNDVLPVFSFNTTNRRRNTHSLRCVLALPLLLSPNLLPSRATLSPNRFLRLFRHPLSHLRATHLLDNPAARESPFPPPPPCGPTLLVPATVTLQRKKIG